MELTYSKAIIRLHHYFRHVIKCTRFLAAGFVNGLTSETTLCSPFPVIPGNDVLCNFSDAKYSINWYCGKPRNPLLSCQDWVMIRDLDFSYPYPFSNAEALLSVSLRQPPTLRLIPNKIKIYVAGYNRNKHDKSPSSLVECSARNFSYTWNLSQPKGYFFASKWKRTDCQDVKQTKSKLLRCLTNATLVFSGDSNLLMFFNRIRLITGCSYLESPSMHWHRARSCTRADIRFHMTWALHGLPAHTLTDHWSMRGDFQAITTTLDSIPTTGKFIVVVHLFIHASIHHLSVFVDRITAIRHATEALLDRNSEATVVIRGPHISSTGWPPVLAGDMMGELMRQQTVKAFEGLHERVVFVDLWGMSIATENPTFHPPHHINQAMLLVLFGHLCPSQ